MSPGSRPEVATTDRDISCDRNGAGSTRRSMPVARSNSARNLATGKPHPLRWPEGWPKAACNSGSSDIEEPDPVVVPGRLGRRGLADALGDPRGEAADDPQGEPFPRRTVGGVGEVPSAEMDGVRTG